MANKHIHEKNLYPILGLLISLACLLFVGIFYYYQTNILLSGNFPFFVIAVTAGLGLLLSLFYLAGKPLHKKKKK